MRPVSVVKAEMPFDHRVEFGDGGVTDIVELRPPGRPHPFGASVLFWTFGRRDGEGNALRRACGLEPGHEPGAAAGLCCGDLGGDCSTSLQGKRVVEYTVAFKAAMAAPQREKRPTGCRYAPPVRSAPANRTACGSMTYASGAAPSRGPPSPYRGSGRRALCGLVERA